MEQNKKMCIPEMTMPEIMEWYQKIDSIRYQECVRVYSKKLQGEQVEQLDYRYIRYIFPENLEPVGNELKFLADVKMLHPFDKGARLTATIADIIRQIPKELIEKTIAFEMVYNDTSRLQRKIFQKEWDSGFYVSVVRLYQAAEDPKDSAKAPGLYPEDFAPVPIGMTAEELQKIREVSEYMLQRGLY